MMAKKNQRSLSSLKIDFREFTKALVKGGIHAGTGDWKALLEDGADLGSALGLVKGPNEIAWLLIYRALFASMEALIKENLDFSSDKVQKKSIRTKINAILEGANLEINQSLFEAPESFSIFANLQPAFSTWLTEQGVPQRASDAISARLPVYFAMALHEEWSTSPDEYSILQQHIQTPFVQANERLQRSMLYRAWLLKQVEEPMLGEPFGLRSLYVAPRAYFFVREENEAITESGSVIIPQGNHVVDLQANLESWLARAEQDDCVRLISGGPGSGKSSFAKIFASKVAQNPCIDVLFIPLHHFEPSSDMIDAVGNFVQTEGYLKINPLLSNDRNRKLLIIFDGLDELALQGKVAARTAQDFVREVQRKVERFNQQKAWLHILITGRELTVQQSEVDFRKSGQILHLIPYYVEDDERNEFIDPEDLLHVDQRQLWWRNYGVVTGESYDKLPSQLAGGHLTEITAQPLLNYLVALSLRRGKLVFTEETNLNVVYADLLKAVYERGWAKYQHASIQGLRESDFYRVLEEIALATWHGDGRTTTVKDIRALCDSSGVVRLLDQFQGQLQNDSQAKVTQLLTAFYFRKSGHNASGDETFEFTHKSFGEYLTARRIVREIRLIDKKLRIRQEDPDEGYDERDALQRWVSICGYSAIDDYLLRFVIDEFGLEHIANPHSIADYQYSLCELFKFLLRHGSPLERYTPRRRFNEERSLSRNSEEALLICINVLAQLTKVTSIICREDPYAFGNWLCRTWEQAHGFTELPLLRALSYLDLERCWLNSRNFWSADFRNSNLKGANLVASDCRYADFRNANLESTFLVNANLADAKFSGAKMNGARFEGISLPRLSSMDDDSEFGLGAMFDNAELNGASFKDADLRYANFKGASLRNAVFSGALLIGADFSGADLTGAAFAGANIEGTNFSGAMLENCDLNKARRV